MLTRRPVLVLCAAALLLASAVLLLPSTLVILFGWLRGESCYRDWPTGSWHREVGQHEEVRSFLSQDYNVLGRQRRTVEERLRELLGRPGGGLARQAGRAGRQGPGHGA